MDIYTHTHVDYIIYENPQSQRTTCAPSNSPAHFMLRILLGILLLLWWCIVSGMIILAEEHHHYYPHHHKHHRDTTWRHRHWSNDKHTHFMACENSQCFSNTTSSQRLTPPQDIHCTMSINNRHHNVTAKTKSSPSSPPTHDMTLRTITASDKS